MTSVLRRGLGLAFDLAGAAAWSLAAFVIVANVVSPTVGAVLALAVFVSGLAFTLNANLHDVHMSALTAGVCPRCRGVITTEHLHRRWEPARNAWLAPQTDWDCPTCEYTHGESWPCPACPEKAE